MEQTIEIKVKRNDLQPHLYFHFKDDAGVGINLTGAVIRATMKNAATGVTKISRQTVGVKFDGTASGNDADDVAAGKGHYEWQAGETDTSGDYLMEFEATPTAGGKFTLPVKELLIVTIGDDLDNT